MKQRQMEMFWLVRRQPVFCTIYVLVFGGIFAGLAWGLGEALMGAYRFVDPARPRGHVPITYAPGLVESVVGMIKYFADGGRLDSTLLAGTGWPAMVRQLFNLTLVATACLIIPLFAGRRVASYAIGVGGVVALSLLIYVVMALGAAHTSNSGAGTVAGLLFLLTMLLVPLFTLSCVFFAISQSSTSGTRAGTSQSNGSPSQ